MYLRLVVPNTNIALIVLSDFVLIISISHYIYIYIYIFVHIKSIFALSRKIYNSKVRY